MGSLGLAPGIPSTEISSRPGIDADRRMPPRSIWIARLSTPANLVTSGPTAALRPPTRPRELGHERTNGAHRPATLPAADGDDGLALGGGGTLVHDQPDRPIARAHRPRGVQEHG